MEGLKCVAGVWISEDENEHGICGKEAVATYYGYSYCEEHLMEHWNRTAGRRLEERLKKQKREENRVAKWWKPWTWGC